MANLGLDRYITRLESIASTAAVWTHLIAFLEKVGDPVSTVFGTAAPKDISLNVPGTICQTNKDGQVDPSVVNRDSIQLASGVLDPDRVPVVSSSKITSGVVHPDRLAEDGEAGDVLTRTSIGQEWSRPAARLYSSLPTTGREGEFVILTSGQTGLYKRMSGAWSKVN